VTLVLVLQGDPATRLMIERELAALSMSVVEATSVAHARTMPKPDLILTSWVLPDGTPRDLRVGVPIVVVSGYDRPPDGEPWTGPWVRKPLHMADLRAAVTTALARAGE
jgi:DNA-binding response OmpR family regulator